MKKKILSIILCMVFAFNSVLVVSAINEQTDIDTAFELYYTYTFSANTYLSITDGTAKSRAYLDANSTATKIVIEMKLQKEGLLWWSTVETYSSTTYGTYASLIEYCTVDSDNYRVKTTFTVYSGTDYETITVYSSEVEC